MAIGLGAFTEGLQGGIKARDAMDKNKQLKHLRKIGISEAENEMAGRRGMAMTDYMQQGGSEDDFEWQAFQQDKDPALMRFGKWAGGKLKGMFSGGGEEAGAMQQMQPAGPQASGATTYGIPQQKADGGMMRRSYADGGRAEYTDEERLQRSYGEHYLTEDEANEMVVKPGSGMSGAKYRRGQAGPQAIPTSGGGIKEFGRDLLRSTGEYFDDTVAVANEGGGGAQDMFREADSARDYGAATSEQVRAGLGTGVAVAKDAFVDNPITQFAAGVLGFDGEGGEGIPTDVPSTPAGDAIGASVDNPETPPEAVAQKAIASAEEDAIKNLDYKLLVDQGVRPEELPSMSTTDWDDYRRKMTMYAGKSGMNPVEAHKMVDERITNMQMTGFQREGQKAMLYLQSGQNREASMALRQAYQYFPNGTSVKFGTMTDPKTGQPAIITMGVSEETGEPTGQPMLITTERLSTMIENMSNPQAFRAWTKDGRDLQLEINKLQSQDDYRQGSLDIQGYKAESDRRRAASAGAGGGMKATDRDRRDKMYLSSMEQAGIMQEQYEDPAVTRSLASAMTIFEMLTGYPTTVVQDEVMTAYEADPENGVQLLLSQARGE